MFSLKRDIPIKSLRCNDHHSVESEMRKREGGLTEGSYGGLLENKRRETAEGGKGKSFTTYKNFSTHPPYIYVYTRIREINGTERIYLLPRRERGERERADSHVSQPSPRRRRIMNFSPTQPASQPRNCELLRWPQSFCKRNFYHKSARRENSV